MMTAPNHNDLQRALGRVEGSQEAMGQRMDKLEKVVEDGFARMEAINKESFEKLDTRLADIEKKEGERRTTWKVVVTIAAGVSGVITWAATWLVELFSKG